MRKTTELEINNFIQEYSRSRVCSIGSVLATVNHFVDAEGKYNKFVYEFTKEEILKTFTDANVVSERTLQNKLIFMKHFCRWLLNEKGLPLENEFEFIGKYDLIPCINHDRKSQMILSKEQFDGLVEDLLNMTDQAIFRLLWLGLGGFALKELTFLEKKNVNRENLCIYTHSGKAISIDAEIYQLLQKAFNETELISYSIDSVKVSQVIPMGIYKTRANARYLNIDVNDPDSVERRYRWAQRRIDLCKKYLAAPLTSESIQNSGFFYCIQRCMEELDMTFEQFLHTEKCKKLSQRYDIQTDLYKQVVKTKFEQFFKEQE